jgi:hypothetical protein
MLRCNIHNLLTDQRYEFTAVDQAAVDAKLVAKEAVYGRPDWNEVTPTWTDTSVEPPVEHPEIVASHHERDVVVTNIDAEIAAAASDLSDRQAARAYFRALDWQTIPDPETRKALRHLYRLVRALDREGS